MKLPKKGKEDSSNKEKRLRKSEVLTSKGLELFDTLRQVRIKEAKAEGVPPYIIFSDKILMDMCIKLPFDKTEMLSVTGVGEYKYEKYGQIFISAIRKFMNDTKENLFYQGAIENLEEKSVSKSKHIRKVDFYLTDEMKQNIKPLGKVTISQFVDHLNGLRDEKLMKRLTAISLTSILKEEGYLKEEFNRLLGRNTVTVTDKGEELGMSLQTRISDKGNEYSVVIYDDKAQEYLIFLIDRLGSYQE